MFNMRIFIVCQKATNNLGKKPNYSFSPWAWDKGCWENSQYGSLKIQTRMFLNPVKETQKCLKEKSTGSERSFTSTVSSSLTEECQTQMKRRGITWQELQPILIYQHALGQTWKLQMQGEEHMPTELFLPGSWKPRLSTPEGICCAAAPTHTKTPKAWNRKSLCLKSWSCQVLNSNYNSILPWKSWSHMYYNKIKVVCKIFLNEISQNLVKWFCGHCSYDCTVLSKYTYSWF